MTDRTWAGIGIVVIVAFFVWIGAMLFANFYVQARCLDAGWASYNVSITLSGYCIREENEYEITRPLREVLNDR